MASEGGNLESSRSRLVWNDLVLGVDAMNEAKKRESVLDEEEMAMSKREGREISGCGLRRKGFFSLRSKEEGYLGLFNK